MATGSGHKPSLGQGLNMKGLKALSSLPLLKRRTGSHCPLPPGSPSLRPHTIHAPVSRQLDQKGRVSPGPGGAAHRLPATFHRLPSPAAMLPASLRAFRASPKSQFALPGGSPIKSALLSIPKCSFLQTLPREQAWTQAQEWLPAPVLCGFLLFVRAKLTLAPTC